MSRRHFEQGLAAVEESLQVPDTTRARGFKGGTLDPRLVATLCIKHPKVPKGFKRTAPVSIDMGRGADVHGAWLPPEQAVQRFCPQPSGSEAQGLSPAPNSSRATRYGLLGLTSRGRTRIETGCKLLEHDRELSSFWTLTLPPAVVAAIEEGKGSTRDLTDEVRRALIRLQKRMGLPEEALGVIEVQPKRFADTGVWAPHWHIVFRSRKHRKGRWLITPEHLDALWRNVVEKVTGVDICEGCKNEQHQASNVQPIRKTVAGYLRAYLKKGSSPQCVEAIGSLPSALVPHQWWFMTDALFKVIQSLTRRLDPLFWAYVNVMEQQLKKDGLLFALWRGKADGTPPRVRYSFPNLEALAFVVAMFNEANFSRGEFRAAALCAAPP